MTGMAIGELIYSFEVPVLGAPAPPGDGGAPGARTQKATTVRYCDICRRWGAGDTTHACWLNWWPRLSDLLLELTRDGRR